MKVLFVLLLSVFYNFVVFAQVKPDTRSRVETFLNEHSVYSTNVYCRMDIKTPECRLLIRYINNVSNKVVKSFQIAFTAPFRQVGGTEFFLENPDDNGFSRFIDSTIDSTVNPSLEEPSQLVEFFNGSLIIKGIKFGTIIADLTFDKDISTLVGNKDGQPVNLKYFRLK